MIHNKLNQQTLKTNYYYSTISSSKKETLPNIWEITSNFKEDNLDLEYCVDQNEYYLYNNYYWKILKEREFNQKFITWLKTTYTTSYTKFEPSRLREVRELFASESQFSIINSKKTSNLQGIWIPFKNGALNSLTKEFKPLEKSLYNTHIINIDYTKNNEWEDTQIQAFILSICNNLKIRIEILQAFLYIILTNKTYYQLILYIYGPGGTGKSTLMNLLTYLLGPDTTLITDLAGLNNRFGTYSLKDKTLVYINDMDYYKGKQPKLLKLLSGNDPIRIEEKYKNPVSIVPNVNIILTGNKIWDIINPSSGLLRRMIYLPFDNNFSNKTLALFKINQTGYPEGALVKDLPLFVNWILRGEENVHEILSKGGEELTRYITSGSLDLETNPLYSWAKDNLEYNKSSKLPVGTAKSDNSTLYGNYIRWCEINNVEPIKIHKFSESLIDKLITSLNWTIVSKKRTAAGIFILGIRFKKTDTNIKVQDQQNNYNDLEETIVRNNN